MTTPAGLYLASMDKIHLTALIFPISAVIIGLIRMAAARLKRRGPVTDFEYRTFPVIVYAGSVILVLVPFVASFWARPDESRSLYVAYLIGWGMGAWIIARMDRKDRRS